MKLLNHIRWRPSRRAIATTPSWTRPISTSRFKLKDAAITSSKTQDLAVPQRAVPKRPSKKWTADELQLVEDERRKGVSPRTVANLLPDRSLFAVEQIMRRLRRNDTGLSKTFKKKFWTAEEKKKLLRFKEAGISFQEVASQFPDRSHASLRGAWHLPRSDMFWIAAPRKKIPWTAEADQELREGVANGTSIEDLATSVGKSFLSVRVRVHYLRIRMPRNWTPEEDETLLRMINEGVILEQIGSHLGRTHGSVTSRWALLRPKDPVPSSGSSGRIRQGVRRFVPSSTEMQTVERLRQEGNSWAEITASTFPNWRMAQVRYFFVSAYEQQLERIARPPKASFSPSEIEDIERLLVERKTWREIAALRYPDLKDQLVRRNYIEQTGHLSNFAIPSADIPEVKRLRSAGSTWKQIVDAKYPGIPWHRVRSQLSEQPEVHSEDSSTNAAEASAQQTGHLSQINLAKTPRLQAAHDTQQPITDATYPCSDLDDIQAFRPTTAGGIRRRWTTDEIKIITDGYDQGAGLKAISDKVPGRTLQAVGTIIARYKRNDPGLLKAMEPRPWTDQELTRLLELRTTGVSWEDIAPHFPNRSHSSLKAAHLRASSEGDWLARRHRDTKRHTYSAEETEFLIDEVTKGTPLEDIASSLKRSIQSLRIRLSSLKIKLPRNWTPESDKSLLRMLGEQYSFEQIAQQLGRPTAGVQARWRRIRPEASLPSPKGTRHPARTFRPSSTEMQDVERLRLKGYTWKDIAASRFPNLKDQHVRLTFTRAFIRGSLPTPERSSSRGFRPSSSDVQVVQRLRQEGRTWTQIASSMYPKTPFYCVRRAFVEQSDDPSKTVRAGFMSPADIAKLRSLRQAKMSWIEITALMYPHKDPKAVCREFSRQNMSKDRRRPKVLKVALSRYGTSLVERGRPNNTSMSPDDVADIQRLRGEGNTWNQIAETKYPDKTAEALRHAFIRQHPGDGRSEDFSPKISPAVLADIQRLRAANAKWHEITALHFPDRNPVAARQLIQRHMENLYGAANKHTWSGPRGPRAFEIAPADFRDITRFVHADMPWAEITRLKYPGRAPSTVRKAFQREEANNPNRNSSKKPGSGRFSAVEIKPGDIPEIERLRAEKRTWREVTVLMYPGQNPVNVRMAFRRQTADEAIGEEESATAENEAEGEED
ncbi:hypothetical protein Q7P35_011387 [Cladosporium inversicolor]